MGQGLEMSDPTLSRGGGLNEMGMADISRANQMGEAAAYSESERDQYNARAKASNVAGNAKLLSTIGTVAGGVVGGPLGAALGGMAGGLIGGAFN
jgi:outer membrane lipoprotein SlyB